MASPAEVHALVQRLRALPGGNCDYLIDKLVASIPRIVAFRNNAGGRFRATVRGNAIDGPFSVIAHDRYGNCEMSVGYGRNDTYFEAYDSFASMCERLLAPFT